MKFYFVVLAFLTNFLEYEILLCRLIRARGRTHCGLFIHFLVERAREKREEVELEKIEAAFAELGVHPKATS
jgi:hypothetical protein